MDKTFAYIMITFFIVCASFITWAAFNGMKRNAACAVIAYSYAVFTWLGIIALTLITIYY